MYRMFLKPIFFRFDPEKIHDFFIAFGEWLGRSAFTRQLVKLFCYYENPALRTRVLGIDFPNPVGLAAGFDKDARLTRVMPAVGFGFMEIGAITRFPYGGNQGARLARLPQDEALIVYYGLKNNGAEAIQKKIAGLCFAIPVGINIAKTNRADIRGDASISDYAATYRLLANRFAYAVLNISCPNAQDGCSFQEPELLDKLLAAISQEKKAGPIFLKISSHLTPAEMDAVLAIVGKYPFVDGFIVANLSKRRDILRLRSPQAILDQIPEGGISGRPLRELSTNLIRYIRKKTGQRYVIIGLGGIFTAADAYEKIKAGASLVQIITGLIYGGPLTVKRINRGLVALLAKDGYANIAEAVGVDEAE